MFMKCKLITYECDILCRCLVPKMNYLNGFARLYLDLALLLSYSDRAKKLEHKVGRPMTCWDVKEVENIESTKQI